VLPYRALAALLGEDQPCYGIEAAGAHDGRLPLDTIEAIAAHHVEALRTVRPHGPYVVGGWSTGAVVAHELARRLVELGESVPLVVCLDGYVLDTGGRPQGAAPAYRLGGLWYRLRGLFQIPGPRQAAAFLRVYQATLRACLRYVPRPAPCPALVFKTGAGSGRRERLRARLSPLYTGPVEVLPAPGRHLTMLDRPHVDALARDLRPILGSPGRAGR
jgi:thioesterase domain-containing protein